MDNLFDAANSAPVQDRLLFDLFTTAFNDNATRGSCRSTWRDAIRPRSRGVVGAVQRRGGADQHDDVSAVSTAPSNRSPVVIHPAGPAGTQSPLGQMVVRASTTRAANFTNADGRWQALRARRRHSGRAAVDRSVAVLESGQRRSRQPTATNGISDEMYEWLPQQVMSLLRVGTPRYVIYCYGQALKPAPERWATLAAGILWHGARIIRWWRKSPRARWCAWTARCTTSADVVVESSTVPSWCRKPRRVRSYYIDNPSDGLCHEDTF